jgi:hypothetical protein
VKSTEAILAPDYPFLEHDRQHFDEKRQTNFRERPFRLLIGDLMPFTCPEMTAFSNDTGRDISKDGLGLLSGKVGRGNGRVLLFLRGSDLPS